MTLAGCPLKLKSGSRRMARVTALPPLLLLTDERRLPDPAAAIAGLPRGSGVIFRHYDAPQRAHLARQLARLCRQRGLLFLVAGDAALARKVGAHGLHLPEHMLNRRIQKPNPRWIIIAAAHSLPSALKAQAMGVDAVLLSPIFATASHPGARPMGPRRLAAWTRALERPVYALGGVNARTVRYLKGIKIAGMAAIDGLTR